VFSFFGLGVCSSDGRLGRMAEELVGDHCSRQVAVNSTASSVKLLGGSE